MSANHQDATPEQLQRLAAAVSARRRTAPLTQAEVAQRGGPSTTTQTKIEAALPPTPADRTLRNLDDGLGWERGSARAVLFEGRSPRVIGEMPRPLEARYGYEPPPRPLDPYTTAELLAEVEQRFAELSLELHMAGRPAISTRQEGPDEVLEPMSPAQRRDELRKQRDAPTELSTRRDPPGDTA